MAKKVDTTGWYASDTPDSESLDFVNELREVIARRITNQIRHHPDLKIDIGPYDQSVRGVKHYALFTLNIRGNVLEVNLRDRSNSNVPNRRSGPTSKFGFKIFRSGDKQIYTLSGLISYINEVWIPGQEDIARRAKNRQGAANELAQALSGFTSTKYDQKSLPQLVYSATRGYSSRNKDELEYYIITDSPGLIEQYKDESYWTVSRKSINLRFIWVALKKGKNMTQVGYFFPYTYKGYQGKTVTSHRTIKSSWFSPKNLMPQLNKLAGRAPCLATLLADPNIGKQ